MSRHIICDRCGAEIDGQEKSGIIMLIWNDAETGLQISEGAERDYCPSCFAALKCIIETPAAKLAPATCVAPKPVDVWTDEQPETPEDKPKAKRQKIDRGKVMALHNAGWNNAKIADEMGCSAWSVSSIISAARDIGEIEK